MTFSLIEIFLAVASIGGIVAIISRKIPEVVSLKEEIKESKSTKGNNSAIDNVKILGARSFFRFKAKTEYRKSIIKFACFLEKILRRLRLHVLKIDATFYNWIRILRENTKSNSKNLSIENKRFFERKMKKLREAAQRWPGQAYQIIEGGVEKSLVLIKTPERKKKSANPPAPKEFKASAENSQNLSQNKILEEEKIYIGKIAKNPRDAESYRMLGMLYFSQENYNDALASFSEIIKIKTGDIHAHNMISKITQKMNK